MPHYDKHFDLELKELKETVLRLGGMVEEQTAKALDSLKSRDIDLAKEVIDNDQKVNDLDLEAEELCIKLLALRQPQGPDLRFVTTAIRVIDNLERMGDLAENISERAIELAKEPEHKGYPQISEMATIANGMLKNCLDAYVRRDTALAEAVRIEDDEVDRLTATLFAEILEHMNREPAYINIGTRLMFISKYIERMADHATNIAEMVIYMVDGKIVRHTEPE